MFLLTSVLFWTVLPALGFAVSYHLIQDATRKYALKHRLLGAFQRELPLAVFVAVFMIVARLLAKQADAEDYWILVNLQILVLFFINLLFESFGSVAIVMTIATITFIDTGAMSLAAWVLLLGSTAIVYFGGRYIGRKKSLRARDYMLPAVVIDSLFWLLMYRSYDVKLEMVGAVLVAFTAACVLMFYYDNSLQSGRQMMAHLSHAAQYDALTQVRNWATFERDLRDAFTASTKESAALILLDIDHFKQVNDTYGHLTGNAVLMGVANQMSHSLTTIEPRAQVYRTGGEEFAVLLPVTTEETAVTVARHCQEIVRTLRVPTATEKMVAVTASFGLTFVTKADRDTTTVFRRADDNLYAAKRAGRDRIVVDNEELSA